MRPIGRRLFLALVVLPLLSACQPVKDLGKALSDLFKGF